MLKLSVNLLLLFKICNLWHQMGHYIVARIAEQKLNAEAPEVLKRVYDMLKPLEPFFPERGNSLLEPAIAADLLSNQFNEFLMYYHFIDVPFAYKNDKAVDLKFNDPFAFNVTYAYESGIKIIKESINPPEKTENNIRYIKNGLIDSLMLRYLLHIVGDIHQPLHSTMLYSKYLYNGTIEKGDQAGNFIPIDDIFDLNLTNLHSLWDAVLGSYPQHTELPLNDAGINYIQKSVDSLLAEYPESYYAEAVKNLKINDWVDESNKIATEFVYSDIDVFPAIRPQYIAEGRRIAKERIALAGYRLAHVLMDAFKLQNAEAQLF